MSTAGLFARDREDGRVRCRCRARGRAATFGVDGRVRPQSGGRSGFVAAVVIAAASSAQLAGLPLASAANAGIHVAGDDRALDRAPAGRRGEARPPAAAIARGCRASVTPRSDVGWRLLPRARSHRRCAPVEGDRGILDRHRRAGGRRLWTKIAATEVGVRVREACCRRSGWRGRRAVAPAVAMPPPLSGRNRRSPARARASAGAEC